MDSANHGRWAFRVGGDVLADRAEDEPSEAAMATVPTTSSPASTD